MAETKNSEEATVSQLTTTYRRDPGKPIVLEYGRKKRKKNRYSRGLRDVQRVEAGLSRIGKRVTKAAADGSSTYDKARKKSAGKKRDGAIRDFIPNMGEAWSEALSEASSLPVDIADTINTKSARRLLRRQLQMAADPLRVWRW